MPQFGASLSDDARGIIYERKMFVIQATGACTAKNCGFATVKFCSKAVLTIYSQFQVYQTSTLAYYGIHTLENTSPLYFTVHAPREYVTYTHFMSTLLFVSLKDTYLGKTFYVQSIVSIVSQVTSSGKGIALLANIGLGIKCLKVTKTIVYHEEYKTYQCCNLNPSLVQKCVCHLQALQAWSTIL